MKELDIKRITDFLATQPVMKAWLFGSYARGEASEDSDVDILVSFDKNTRIGMKFITIVNSLESILQRQVDLVEEGSLLPWVKPFVDKEKILIYEGKNKG